MCVATAELFVVIVLILILFVIIVRAHSDDDIAFIDPTEGINCIDFDIAGMVLVVKSIFCNVTLEEVIEVVVGFNSNNMCGDRGIFFVFCFLFFVFWFDFLCFCDEANSDDDIAFIDPTEGINCIGIDIVGIVLDVKGIFVM